jgi:PAS domain-containing protein
MINHHEMMLPISALAVPNALDTRAPEAALPLQRLADEASIIMWRSDAQHACVWMNPAAVALLPGPELPQMSAWMRHIHPEDVEHRRAAHFRRW